MNNLLISAGSSTQTFQKQTFLSGQVTVKQADSAATKAAETKATEAKTAEMDAKQTDSVQTASASSAVNSQEAVSVSISREGLEKLAERQTAFSPDIDTDETRQLETIDLTKIKDKWTVFIDFNMKLKDVAANSENDGWDRNLMTTYAEMYDEIKSGYADGTREIYTIDENGETRLATEDEEIAWLDAAVDLNVDFYESYWNNKESSAKFEIAHERYQEWKEYYWAKRHGLKAERRSDEEWERYAALKQEEFAKYKKENYIENFAERVTQMRAFVKAQYSQYANNVTGLVDAAYQSLEPQD